MLKGIVIYDIVLRQLKGDIVLIIILRLLQDVVILIAVPGQLQGGIILDIGQLMGIGILTANLRHRQGIGILIIDPGQLQRDIVLIIILRLLLGSALVLVYDRLRLRNCRRLLWCTMPRAIITPSFEKASDFGEQIGDPAALLLLETGFLFRRHAFFVFLNHHDTGRFGVGTLGVDIMEGFREPFHR